MFFISPQTFLFSLLYLSLTLIIISLDNFFAYWVIIELRTLVFIGVSYSSFKNNFRILLVFFIIQTISAFRLLLFFIASSALGFTFSLLIKLAMFPYHFWYFSLVPSFPNFALFFSMTIFKIPSIYILRSFSHLLSYEILFLSSILTIMVGGFIMVFRNDLRLIVVGSSIANNTWFVFSQLSRRFIFILYFSLYYIFLYMVFTKFSNLFSFSSQNTYFMKNYLVIFSLVTISGLPPFPLFYVKMLIVLQLISNLSLAFFIFVVILANVLVLLGYIKFIFNYMLNFYGNSNFLALSV